MNSKSLLFPFLILLTLVSGCQKAAVSSRPAAPGYSSAELENTYWKLLTIYAQKVTTTPDQSREAFLQFQKNEKKSRGFAGCNNFSGKYETDGHNLQFGPLISTRKFCQDTMKTEQLFLKALTETTDFSISRETLSLYSADKQTIATFKAVYLK